jgi:SAM-dependent methyltransferase
MAPDIAFGVLAEVRPRTILDPMAGSGTVLRIASDLGCRGIGFDIDPLAVLISRVWTTPVEPGRITEAAERAVSSARRVSAERVCIPWIDDDSETAAFVGYWFGEPQRRDLRRLSWILHRRQESPLKAALQVALSRIIITKDVGASLARDVSHSRAHRVWTMSDYDVFSGFRRAAARIDRILTEHPPRGNVVIDRGDARDLSTVPDENVDLIITSPPYLNAIDYMRAHRLSLVWIGYSLHQLRAIRATSLGCERSLSGALPPDVSRHLKQVDLLDRLSPRLQGIIARYVLDLSRVVAEAARVLRPGGHLVLVMGDTSVYGIPVRNSMVARSIAAAAGLKLQSARTRDLLARRRYLPPPNRDGPGIRRRIGTETILTFRKPAS